MLYEPNSMSLLDRLELRLQLAIGFFSSGIVYSVYILLVKLGLRLMLEDLLSTGQICIKRIVCRDGIS